MSKPSDVAPPTTSHTKPPGSSTLSALRTLSTLNALDAMYQTLLDHHVFQLTPLADRKDDATFRRTLTAPSSRLVLAIIWKESPFVSIADLLACGMQRAYSFDEPLNAYALAGDLAEDAKAFGKTHKRIEAVVRAGVAFNLITRRPVQGSTTIALQGTHLLHAFMMRLDEAAQDYLSDGIHPTTETI